MISKHIGEYLNKNNLHHAYLIEGAREEILPEILEFVESLGIKKGSPDFFHIDLDSFKIEDARNVKSYATEKGFSTAKKIFVISANNFLLEAQNSMLKVFEEPIPNTHFFVVIPDTNALLKTFASRFYIISNKSEIEQDTKIAEQFIKMPLVKRIDFVKELVAMPDEDTEEITTESSRSKALKFLNSLELTLHNKLVSRMPLDTKTNFFEHFFKVRKFLRMPGSSTKTLMESVAIVIPNL